MSYDGAGHEPEPHVRGEGGSPVLKVRYSFHVRAHYARGRTRPLAQPWVVLVINETVEMRHSELDDDRNVEHKYALTPHERVLRAFERDPASQAYPPDKRSALAACALRNVEDGQRTHTRRVRAALRWLYEMGHMERAPRRGSDG